MRLGPGRTMSKSNFVKHIPCPSCKSSDANSLYDDGHTHCFACGETTPGEGESPRKPKSNPELLDCSYAPLASRNIGEEVCRKYRYGHGQNRHGAKVHIANYLDASGNTVAQHIRGKGKTFSWVGKQEGLLLFGQHLWSGDQKRIVITEGEIDALSVASAMPGWPVVSIPNGANAAKKSLQKHLEWLESFGEIVLCFDMDDPGQEAANDCAPMFTPGKCKLAVLPLKDASDMWMAGRHKELTTAIMFNAKVYRPDGVIRGDDLSIHDYILNFKPHSDASYPWPEFDKALYGMRQGELVTHTAGTGIGKSTICREIAYHLGVNVGQRVGIVALEENVRRVGQFMVSIAANQRLHLGDTKLTKEEKEALFKASVGNGNFFLYDHWGSTKASDLLAKIRYMVRGEGCRWIILDHLSIVVSGLEGEDERKNLDKLMTDLRSLVEETQCGMHVISHLSRKHDGKSHEEGAPISLRDLRGSHSIVQLSDIVLGYERNQQDEEKSRVIQVRKLKDRYTGETGVVGMLEYDADTGRVVEVGDFKNEARESENEEMGF